MLSVDISDEPHRRAAAHIARKISEARGVFHLALSGGKTPAVMIRALDVQAPRLHVWQVDERVVPDDHPSRNVAMIRRNLEIPCVLHAMPVDAPDADVRYAQELLLMAGGTLDLVQLGLGADGHTASLVPGDPVLDIADRDVAFAGPYEGTRRLTLTYPALARARERVWLVVGADKRDALQQLLASSPDIPAGRLPSEGTVFADPAATR